MMRFSDPLAELGRRLTGPADRTRGGIMPMDAYELDGVYTLRFDLPGVGPDDVDLTVEGSVLAVTAERPPEETDRATWLLRERPSGTHSREARLGERSLDASRVGADFDNGVLTVTIPMREEVKPHKVPIFTSSGNVSGSGD